MTLTGVLEVAPVVLEAVDIVGIVVLFSSDTWKAAMTVRLLSGCTGQKFLKIGAELFFLRLRRRFKKQCKKVTLIKRRLLTRDSFYPSLKISRMPTISNRSAFPSRGRSAYFIN